jgi:regulatory protein
MYEEWMEKMRRWCSLRERCTWDVAQKLRGQSLSTDLVSKVVEALEIEGFLSDERFVTSYVRTHAEHKHWGPRKIVHGLMAKGFSSSDANRAVAAFPQGRFSEILDGLIERRKAELEVNRDKVIRFLASRGFPVNDIFQRIEEAEGR